MERPRSLFLALCLLASGLVSAMAAPPNVLIIYTDDHGSIDANCYGATDLTTPTIDKLASTGVRFTQMLAPSAICSASRAGLMTGRIPPRAGVPANVSSEEGKSGMPQTEITIADLMKSAGYRTGHIGKWHLGYTPETMPLGQGFDYTFGHMGGCIDNYSHFFYWQGPNRHDLWRNGEEVWEDGKGFGQLMVDEVKNFVSQESAQPFFVYWAINWPHYPLQGFDKWRQHYAEKGLESPRDKYAAFVSSMDEIVGEVIDHLEAIGQRENTLIIFQSDHGHSVEERTFHGGGNPGPYRGHKGTLWEGGLRVPSIVSWPGTLPEGEVRDQLVVGTDWFPTIADLAGVGLPENHKIDGKSIAKVIQDDAASPHDRRYWQLGNGKRAQWAVREGNWKLLGNPKEAKQGETLFLADLESDIGESQNLVEQNPEVVQRLQAYQEEMAADIEATLAESAGQDDSK